MKLVDVFSQISPDIRYSKVSDYAFRVYAEIYAFNYSKKYKITNKEIASNFGKSIVQTSRAINELKKNKLIKVSGARERRIIEIVNEQINYDVDSIAQIKGLF